MVVPSLFIPPKITALLHCADPFFSKYLKDFKFVLPFIIRGKYFSFFRLKFAPNLLNGSVILLKSLLDKLLSPINFIGYFVSIRNPNISLPKVPEFSAFRVKFFLN